MLPVGTADAPATRTPCVENNEQNTTRLTDSSKSKQNNLTNIMYLNARSLKSVTTNVNKVRDFSALIELSQSDIYGITYWTVNCSRSITLFIAKIENILFNIKEVVVF